MTELDRTVAGVRCREVLEHLSEYMDGDLPPEDVERIEAHLRGCDRCERFGGYFGEIVGALRRQLGEPEPIGQAMAGRLADRLRAEL